MTQTQQVEALQARIAELEDDLQYIERWAVHHASKPSMTATEALSCIQHYPSIQAITDSYADGKRPDTFNPFARIRELEEAAALQSAQAAPQCLHQIAEPAATPWKDHRTAALVNDLRDCAKTYGNTQQLRERIATIVAPLCDQLKAVELAAAPQAVQPAVPLPLLVRDIARDLGITVPEACNALKPLGNYSTNSAVTAEMARMLRAHLRAAPAHPAEGVPAQDRLAEVDLPDVEDMAHSALQEALSFGLGHDVLHRWMRKVMTQTQSALAATQPAAQELEESGIYYLQDARWSGMVGNCPSFWRPDGTGYTTNLDEAGRFTFEEAMKQHNSRKTDLPWLCSELDKLRRPTVDCQCMPRSWDEQSAALAAQAKQGEQANG